MNIARLRAVLKSWTTWLTFVLMFLSIVASEAPAVGPIGEDVAAWALRIAAWLTVAVNIIRRTVEVDKNDRGIL